MITERIPVGKDYNLRVIDYSATSKYNTGISAAISTNKRFKMNDPKGDIRELAENYLNNYSNIVADRSWSNEDL